jgi:hypothetical protein
MRGELRPAALVATAGEGPVIATATAKEASAYSDGPKGRQPEAERCRPSSHRAPGRPGRGTELPVMAGNGRRSAPADRQPEGQCEIMPKGPAVPADRLHGLVPVGQTSPTATRSPSSEKVTERMQSPNSILG